MAKSRPSTAAADIRDPYNVQMTFRAQACELRALHLLAERDGSKAASLLRRWIRESYRAAFGKEVA